MTIKRTFQQNNKHSEQQVIAELLEVLNSKNLEPQVREKLLAVLEQLSDRTKFPFSLSHEQQSSAFGCSYVDENITDASKTNYLGIAGELARNAFDHLSPLSHRKQYGQFFTPPAICALACSAGIFSAKDTVIDPMCGTGAMLWAAKNRLNYLEGAETGSITGIELDALAAAIATLPPSDGPIQGNQELDIIRSDAFLEVSGLLSGEVSRHEGHYDAVVGNPPYVRYQNFTSMYQTTYPELVRLFQKELPKEPKSVIADTIIRASLIAHLVRGKGKDLREVVHDAVAILRSQRLPTKLDDVDACWLKMVMHYSGLADLSLPAWLLTWRLARPGAIIAYVTTASWKNRVYARFLRYFMLRMLQPIFFIEQEGSWFDDALIPTSLMVFRARSPEEVALSLKKREQNTSFVRVIRIRQEYNLAHSMSLQKAAFYLDPDHATKQPLEESAYADMIIRAIEAQECDTSNELWTINMVPEKSLIDELFNEDRSAQRAGRSKISIQNLEEPYFHSGQSRRVRIESPTHHTTIPFALQQALDIPAATSYTFKLLTDYGIEVNQGLRTGCNPFFYVHRLNDDEWMQYFPNESPIQISLALEHPHKYPDQFMAIIARVRQLQGFAVEEPPSRCPPSTLVKLDKEFGERLALFPTSTLKPAVRYQRNMIHWSILDASHLSDWVVVTGSGATPQDYARLSSYPDHWIRLWEGRYDLSLLPSGLSAYILVASQTTLERNGISVPIPQLSAVAPNLRLPAPPAHLSLFDDVDAPSAIPAWWYTLPILPRHSGAVFVARVNDDQLHAYLNLSTNPVLIDANFSTLSINTTQISAELLFALLNSTWAKALLEAIATPMGGGALKVEAAHLRILPLPHLKGESIAQLEVLGKQLARLTKTHNNVPDILRAIDEIVVENVAAMIDLDSSHILRIMNDFSYDLRRRRRKQSIISGL